MLEKIIILILGGIIGSFINMLCHRLPRGLDIIFKRSHCVKCGFILKMGNLIPVFSWIFARGKCVNCKKSIGISYLAVELLTITVFLLIQSKFGFGQKSFILMMLSAILITISVIDLKHYIICDSLLVAILPIAIFLGFENGKTLVEMFSMAIFALLFFIFLNYIFTKILKKDSLGFGDVKLFSLCFLMLKWSQIPFFLFLCGIFGVGTSLLWNKISQSKVFPFAPAICLALFASTTLDPF